MTINADSRSRGIATIADLYANSRRLPSGCLLWLGATENGSPRIWTFDHDKGDKTVLSGPRAVHNIAHGALRGRIAYMGCFTPGCVHPVHVRSATNRAELGSLIARAGIRKGKQTPLQLACAAKGRAAQGIIDTPPEIVDAIRREPAEVTHTAIAKRTGLTISTISRLRRWERRVGVLASEPA
jgi:hypothetical protein